MSHSLRELYLTRLREFYRQPARIFWVYGFPIILAVTIGLAFNRGGTPPIQVDLARNDSSPPIETALREYDARVKALKQPGLVLRVEPEDVALRRLRTGKTPLVVIPGASRVMYHYDPTRPEATTARAAIDDILQAKAGRTNPVETTDLTRTEPGARYIDFLIPGLIGLNAMGGGLWGIGLVVVNFRIRKLLKCLMATPMPRRNFLLALIGSRLTFLLPDLAVLLLLGTVGFGMPIRGSLLLVAVADVFGALAFAGIGLLIASRAQSNEAVNGLMNLVMIPMWLFSGVFFSTERFPAAAQPFVQALPLTQLLIALRGVILEGMGWLEVAPSLLILAAWAVGSFFLALRLFRWS